MEPVPRRSQRTVSRRIITQNNTYLESKLREGQEAAARDAYNAELEQRKIQKSKRKRKLKPDFMKLWDKFLKKSPAESTKEELEKEMFQFLKLLLRSPRQKLIKNHGRNSSAILLTESEEVLPSTASTFAELPLHASSSKKSPLKSAHSGSNKKQNDNTRCQEIVPSPSTSTPNDLVEDLNTVDTIITLQTETVAVQSQETDSIITSTISSTLLEEHNYALPCEETSLGSSSSNGSQKSVQGSPERNQTIASASITKNFDTGTVIRLQQESKTPEKQEGEKEILPEASTSKKISSFLNKTSLEKRHLPSEDIQQEVSLSPEVEVGSNSVNYPSHSEQGVAFHYPDVMQVLPSNYIQQRLSTRSITFALQAHSYAPPRIIGPPMWKPTQTNTNSIAGPNSMRPGSSCPKKFHSNPLHYKLVCSKTTNVSLPEINMGLLVAHSKGGLAEEKGLPVKSGASRKRHLSSAEGESHENDKRICVRTVEDGSGNSSKLASKATHEFPLENKNVNSIHNLQKELESDATQQTEIVPMDIPMAASSSNDKSTGSQEQNVELESSDSPILIPLEDEKVKKYSSKRRREDSEGDIQPNIKRPCFEITAEIEELSNFKIRIQNSTLQLASSTAYSLASSKTNSAGSDPLKSPNETRDPNAASGEQDIMVESPKTAEIESETCDVQEK